MRTRKHRPKLLALIFSMIACGCGPLHSPMPVRFADEQQKAIDDAWDRAFQPVDHLDGQALLDALISSGGYEMGVDRLRFRSEKNCAAGLVVMEIQFDRAQPALDRFAVTVQDGDGRVIRQQVYMRDQVERTCAELFDEIGRLAYLQGNGQLSKPDSQRLAELQRRIEACQHVFPKFEDASSGPR